MVPVFTIFAMGFLVMNNQLWPECPFWVKAAWAVAFGICQVRCLSTVARILFRLSSMVRQLPVLFCLLSNCFLSLTNLTTTLQVLPLLHVMHDSSHAALGHSEGGWKVGAHTPLRRVAIRNGSLKATECLGVLF